MDLQTAFYIIGIIFMSLMLLITIGIAIAIFVIKAKIDHIHRRVEEKLAVITNITHLGTDVVAAAKKVIRRK